MSQVSGLVSRFLKNQFACVPLCGRVSFPLESVHASKVFGHVSRFLGRTASQCVPFLLGVLRDPFTENVHAFQISGRVSRFPRGVRHRDPVSGRVSQPFPFFVIIVPRRFLFFD